ncbi:hypothetical protein KDN24_22880 [Bacillus sp. Bva_UNVM-123]|uniref:hypothetical protein n=1 Tax=Bacillus sp. Bva_UNVM-123 TaxID=2829798 RepID=UPI00391F7800
MKPHELYAAQGFPKNYLFQYYPNGKKIRHDEQIKRVGNSFPPDLPDALVRANLPEMYVEYNRYKPAVSY